MIFNRFIHKSRLIQEWSKWLSLWAIWLIRLNWFIQKYWFIQLLNKWQCLWMSQCIIYYRFIHKCWFIQELNKWMSLWFSHLNYSLNQFVQKCLFIQEQKQVTFIQHIHSEVLIHPGTKQVTVFKSESLNYSFKWSKTHISLHEWVIDSLIQLSHSKMLIHSDSISLFFCLMLKCFFFGGFLELFTLSECL